eukprot:TRINITY_DN882_c0_g1_i1.p1 TRINITY_DN882_c0_g1~~TRINITY_DN882_c0_g1_i1.p1  ORF type:complete len:609 (-),score=97.12 TRINITY_DN882_c0_g1_i1:32-1765(-)
MSELILRFFSIPHTYRISSFLSRILKKKPGILPTSLNVQQTIIPRTKYHTQKRNYSSYRRNEYEYQHTHQHQQQEQKPVKIKVMPPSSKDVISRGIMTLIAVGVTTYIIIWFFRKAQSSMIDVMLSSSKPKLSGPTSVTFSDVKGVDEAKNELQEIVDFLKNPQKFQAFGARHPKGLLLVGSPGTGKTLLARAVAGEANVPFYYCSASEFDEVFVGLGARRIRNLFDEAKKTSPAIIFMDEIDSIGGARTAESYREGTLNQLLTEIDGFEQDTNIIVIAATNFPDSLDAALTRPGRFDKTVTVPLPDVKGRQDILDLYLNKVKTSPDVSSQRLARATPGLTGADLQNIVNLAAIKAGRAGKPNVTMKMLEEAFDDVNIGKERRSTVIPLESRRVSAYREAGHALLAFYTEGSHPIRKASIIPRGSNLGIMKQMPEKDVFSISRKQILCMIAINMAGRAAEEYIMGREEISTGSSKHFQSATNLATKMVTEWGMSEKLGVMYYERSAHDSLTSRDTLNLIDSEIEQILKNQFHYAKKVLTAHEQELHKLASALLEYETLTGEEITMIITGQPIPQRLT